MRKAIPVKISHQNKRFSFYLIIYCNFVPGRRRGKKRKKKRSGESGQLVKKV